LRDELFLLVLRILAAISLIGFVVVGLLFAFKPGMFNGGVGVTGYSAIWHSLALAFMATVSALALMIALDPRCYWPMLLPLAIGKAVSSMASGLWYRIHPWQGFLSTNALVDGAIALVALVLYVEAWRRGVG
jgi:hypothetical protein